MSNQQESKPIEFRDEDGKRSVLRAHRDHGESSAATVADLVAALRANDEVRTEVLDELGHREEVEQRMVMGLTARAEAAEAKVAELERQNDPAYDATDAAHPAWWRGHDNGAKGMAERVASLQARLDVVREDRRLQRVRATDAEIALDKLQAQLREREEAIRRLLEYPFDLRGEVGSLLYDALRRCVESAPLPPQQLRHRDDDSPDAQGNDGDT